MISCMMYEYHSKKRTYMHNHHETRVYVLICGKIERAYFKGA